SYHTLRSRTFYPYATRRHPHSFPTRRSSDLEIMRANVCQSPSLNNVPSPRASIQTSTTSAIGASTRVSTVMLSSAPMTGPSSFRSEEHTSELQSRENLVCRLLLEKKKINDNY